MSKLPTPRIPRWKVWAVVGGSAMFAFALATFDARSWTRGLLAAPIAAATAAVGLLVGGRELWEKGNLNRAALGGTIMAVGPIAVGTLISQRYPRRGGGGDPIGFPLIVQVVAVIVFAGLLFIVFRSSEARDRRAERKD